MKGQGWLVPSIILTTASGATVLALISDYGVLLAAMSIYPAWIAAAVVLAAVCLLAGMVRARVARPMLELRRLFAEERGRLAFVALVVLIAGLNMIVFMWMKPLLNYLVPFWADPLLANLDRQLFLGHDPWTLLTWLNFPFAGIIYHQAWFVMMILALLIVAWAPSSPRKSAMLLTYFVLWSLVGPAIHSLLPAAGPIFYARMGFGSRFIELQQWEETRQVADYLWAIYDSRNFGAGSGISAMPSLHVTTAAWTTMAILVFARGLALPAMIFAAMIFLMSIALGWHYALDGIVGAACAIGCYAALLAWFGRDSPARQQQSIAAPLSPGLSD